MRLPFVFVLLPLAALVRSAAAPATVDLPDFNRDIRPILSEKCFRCHGPDEGERKGGEHGVRLDLASGAWQDLGGYQAIAPGHPDKSEALIRILSTDDEDIMPPPDTGKKVTPAEVDLLRRWIAGGAHYATHWAYEKPRRVAPPAVQLATWPRQPLDAFILAALEKNGLTPQPEADRTTLARRVALDLTGLPPTAEEVAALNADPRPDAYERFVDRQLAKPSYGEHWARAWLDLARYADSRGYADDQPRSIWRYRDYVIDAFNRNVPFDQFTIEQLAGDLLPHPTQEQLFATGFHRNTMNNTEGGTEDEEFRSAAIVDRVNTTMSVWMGSSLACAQCHTHKYDPFTQTEYFQLYAIFNQTEDADRDDESPILEFYTAAQQRERDQWKRDLAAVTALLKDAGPAHAAAAERWAARFPATLAWNSPAPTAARTVSKSSTQIGPGGDVTLTAADKKETVLVELPAPAGPAITALRLESLPTGSLPQGGAGGADGNFVLTRLRAGVKGAEPFRNVRYIRVTLPGKDRTLSLAEIEVFSGGRNVVASGRASQSSTFESLQAARAIDGNRTSEPAGQSLSQTGSDENPWWEIDLGAVLPVERVVVWGRTGIDSTPGGLHLTALDESRQLVWEQLGREPPRPNRVFDFSDAIEFKLKDVVVDYAQPEFDETYVLSDSEVKPPNVRKRTATKKGWGVAGAVQATHTLAVQPLTPVTLRPGESLVVTLEFQSAIEHAVLQRFRLGYTTDAAAAEHLRTPPEVIAAAAIPAPQRSAAQRGEIVDYFVRAVAADLKPEQEKRVALERSLREMPIQSSPIARELPADRQRVTHLQLRGNYLAWGNVVQPGVPQIFPPLTPGEPANRLGLARWLVSEENPLTARVLANRLWESIFGLGLVRTSEEFGSQGELPTHPELLDWLATELHANHWDTRAFLRMLVTSASYRQSSRVTPAALAADPENRLLSRGPRIRLSAEMVRDQALAVSGLLNPELHGPSVRPFQPAFGLAAAFGSTLDWKQSTGSDRFRRGLYTEWRRSSPYPSMVTFDAPNREVCTLRRNRSNTPLQALVMLNDPVYVEAAQSLARHLIAESDGQIDQGIRAGFRRVLLREPTTAEIRPLTALYSSALASYRQAPDQAVAFTSSPEPLPPALSWPAPELAAWTALANVLLNLDETLMKP